MGDRGVSRFVKSLPYPSHSGVFAMPVRDLADSCHADRECDGVSSGAYGEEVKTTTGEFTAGVAGDSRFLCRVYCYADRLGGYCGKSMDFG